MMSSDTPARKPNKAARLLRSKMSAKGWSQGDVEERLGLKFAGVVSRWLNETRKPGRTMALKIQETLLIPADMWDQEPDPDPEGDAS